MKRNIFKIILCLLSISISCIIIFNVINNTQNKTTSSISKETDKPYKNIPIELIYDEDNIDLSAFEGYHYNLEKFIWCEKYDAIESIQYDYHIDENFKHNNTNCDYMVSIGNELKEIYIDKTPSVDDASEYKFNYYPVFKETHVPFKIYIYALDKRYDLLDLEYNTNLICEFNENNNVPYILNYYDIPEN